MRIGYLGDSVRFGYDRYSQIAQRLRTTSSNEVHRAEDRVPGEIEHGPKLAVEDTEGACVAPQHVGVPSQRHERSHSVPLCQSRLSEEARQSMRRRQCAAPSEIACDGAEQTGKQTLCAVG